MAVLQMSYQMIVLLMPPDPAPAPAPDGGRQAGDAGDAESEEKVAADLSASEKEVVE